MTDFEKLLKQYPEQAIKLKQIYEDIKHIPKSVKFLDFALSTNMDLEKAKDFFIKVYGS